jgi:hypothetical protein
MTTPEASPADIQAVIDQIEASAPRELRATIEALPPGVRLAAYARAVRQLVGRMVEIDRLTTAVVLADLVRDLRAGE